MDASPGGDAEGDLAGLLSWLLLAIVAIGAAAFFWGGGCDFAHAAQFDGTLNTQGVLTPTPQAATGASANSVLLGRSKVRTVRFILSNTAGTATVVVEVNCAGSTTPLWAALKTTSTAMTVENDALDVGYGSCEYRTNATACTGCALSTSYMVLPELQ